MNTENERNGAVTADPAVTAADVGAEAAGLAENAENVGTADLADVSGAAAETAPAEASAESAYAPEIMMRARELTAQARVIEKAGGDVMRLFQTDAAGRDRVLRGEWDFADLWNANRAETVRGDVPPAPVRSANGSVGGVDVRGMTDGQFERLNRLLREGGTVEMR